ncbi:tyrosine-type recombinase/integrase [Nanoarchaeota archaeon]
MKREMYRRRYSSRTIQTYSVCLKEFIDFVDVEPRRFTKKHVKEFLYYISDRELSGSTMNLYYQSIRFAMVNILNKRNFFLNLPYSRLPKRLPVVLNKEEVCRLIGSIDNIKHRLMIKLLYSSGLRLNELINLRISDLEIDSGYGWVRNGKGKKDRIFIIASCLKEELRDIISCRSGFVFLGRFGKYSHRTIQEIVRKATITANIKKRVHPHTLRHSFATHLIENGYSLSSVQSLLGHSSPLTTQVYVHIARPKMLNIKSPLDSLIKLEK